MFYESDKDMPTSSIIGATYERNERASGVASGVVFNKLPGWRRGAEMGSRMAKRVMFCT